MILTKSQVREIFEERYGVPVKDIKLCYYQRYFSDSSSILYDFDEYADNIKYFALFCSVINSSGTFQLNMDDSGSYAVVTGERVEAIICEFNKIKSYSFNGVVNLTYYKIFYK